MSTRAMEAHSLAEAYLYVMATTCKGCGKGPLEVNGNRKTTSLPERIGVDLDTTCKSCSADFSFSFLIPPEFAQANPSDVPLINSSTDPSRIIDIAQWLMLFRLITEAASRETNKVQARYLGLEAALCLEEAMKFFEDDENDLAPSSAFFTDESRKRLRENPEQFSKQRLVHLRSKLPNTSVMRANLVRKKKPWWRLWG